MGSLIYEDKPHYDIWVKAILVLPVAIFLIPGLYLITSDPETAIGLFVTAVLMAIIYWAIFPRKYCILDSKVKIALGGPLSFSIPFDSIETARIPKGITLGINFVTSFSTKNAVEIARKRRLNVNITPSNRELFLSNLGKALNNWRDYNTRVR
ncbi:MAG TPA: hypothetical protein G4O12_04590 [Dehalococcoidia bacterium]|nr:hypothetical protein [Dehalococcoidia bacterium]